MQSLKKFCLAFLLAFLICEFTLRVFVFLYPHWAMSRFPVAKGGEGLHRIICIGESTTAGAKLWPNWGYPQALEKLLNVEKKAWRVYNLGVTAITSSEIANHFSRNLSLYKPEIVVINCGNNTNEPFMQSSSKKQKILFVLENLKTVRLARLLAQIADGLWHKDLEIQRIYSDVYLAYRRSSPWISLQAHETNLDYMVTLAQQRNVKVILCNYFNSPANPFLRSYALKRKLTFCDQEKAFSDYPSKAELISDDGWHPSSRGYEFMARELLSVMKTAGFIAQDE